MQPKTIFITGTSSGIGYDLAYNLTKQGHKVIASCRNPKDVDKLNQEGIKCISLDVSDESSVANAFTELKNLTKGKLDVLINNAGFGQAGALEDLSLDDIRAQFEVNVFGLINVTKHAIPLMRVNGQGRIINISSVLGIISLPFRGAYNASKYAVEGLSDTLRLELKSSNIKVISIQPGPISSNFRTTSLKKTAESIDLESSYFKQQYQKIIANSDKIKNDSIFTKKPGAVTKKVIHAITAKRPKEKYLITMPTFLFFWLKRLLPTKILDNLLLFVSKEEIKS